MSLKCIDFLNVIKSIIVHDCFVICVGSSLLSKTVDVTERKFLSVFFPTHYNLLLYLLHTHIHIQQYLHIFN